MAGHIANVQISHAGPDDDELTEYWQVGAGARLAAMYGELLGMVRIYIGYHKLVHEDGHLPEIGFEYSPEDRPPEWGNPERPTQVHLEIAVRDLAEASVLVASHGATHLHDGEVHRVFADPAGHPFCIYEHGHTEGGPLGRITHVTFDCPSPDELARFYESFLDMTTRSTDTPERVEIEGRDEGVGLAFVKSDGPPPRWPDPTHPAQLHLDLGFRDDSACDLAARLGAIRLPLAERPDHLVYADPAGHPFCLGIGPLGRHGPGQVADYEEWVARQGDVTT